MTDDLERFKTILAHIALQDPYMSLKDGLLRAVEVEGKMVKEHPELFPPKDPNDIEAMARWAYYQPSVTSHLPHRKIDAIKALRVAHPSCGLREAKEAVEWMMAYLTLPPT